MRTIYGLVLAFFFVSPLLTGQDNLAKPNEWIVQLDAPDDLTALQAWAKQNNAEVRPIFKDLNAYVISIDDADGVKKLRSAIVKRKWNIYPNIQTQPRYSPNDPDYPSQWALPQINMPEVWDITTGSGVTPRGDDIVVAIFDDGFDINHPDYITNIWINDGEIPDNGVDDDANGYVDDHQGWNPRMMSDEHRLTTHGTEVAGVIGAVGDNGSHVAGVNWHVKLMLTSASTPSGISIADIIASYEYIYEQRRLYNETDGSKGAFVVVSNFSGGVDKRFPSDFPLWCQVYDKLGEVGILNVTATSNTDVNVEQVGDLPTLCPSDYLLTVTNSDRGNNLSPGASYGEESIDMAAPGVDIVTTTIDGSITNSFDGASASAPFVAGVASLIYEVLCDEVYDRIKSDPSYLPLEIKKAIMSSVVESPTLSGRTVSGGALDALAAFEYVRMQKGLGDCCKVEVDVVSQTPETCRGAEDAMITIQSRSKDIRGRLVYELKNDEETKMSNDSIFSLLSGGEYTLSIMAERDASCRIDTIIRIPSSTDSCSFGTFELRQVLPNPTNGELSFFYQLDEAKHFQLSIYDAAGRRVDKIVNTDGIGSGIVKYDATRLVQGVYFAVMRANDLYSSVRFSVF